MNQTRIESLIERACDISTSFFFAWCLYEYYVRNHPELSSFNVTLMFTVISLVRGYYWRRFFNKGLHKIVHKNLTKFLRR
jgi:hypothetical protein